MALFQNDVIYFVLTDRFHGKKNPAALKGVDKNNPFWYHGGNFDGIIEKIPYLKNLGITALWITPVYEQMQSERISAQPYHGYWPLDFNKVDRHLYIDNGKFEPGSKKYVKALADELHKNDIKLILDMVVNHTGYDHPGALNLESNPTPVKADWFNRMGLDCSTDIIKGELAGLPDFNLDKLDVIDYHIQAISSWIKETGIDAVRMDTAKHVERGFWNYFKTQIRGSYPSVYLLGEVLVFSIDELTDYQKYWGFDSLFDFPVQEAIQKVFIQGQSLCLFYSPFNSGTGIFERDYSYSNHNRLVSLLDNHDLPGRFMTVAMNHCNNDKEKAAAIIKLALTFIFTTRGIPQIYYGTELGMEGGPDPDNRKDFEWNKIDTDNNVKQEYSIEYRIFEHTKKIIAIRKKNKALYCGSSVCLYVDHFILVYFNYFDDNVIITAINNGWLPMQEPLRINISNQPAIPQRVKNLINDKILTCQLSGKRVKVENGWFELKIDGKEAMILL